MPSPRGTGKKVGAKPGVKKLGYTYHRRMKERRFVTAYVACDGNGTEAAMKAGLAKRPDHAAIVSTRFLKRAWIRDAIERKIEAMGATAERLIEELGRVAFADARDLDEARELIAAGEGLGGIADHVASAIKDVAVSWGKTSSVHVAAHDKVGAIRLLAQMRKYIVNRHELSGPGGGPIPVAAAVTFYLPQSAHVRLGVVDASGNGGGCDGDGDGA